MIKNILIVFFVLFLSGCSIADKSNVSVVSYKIDNNETIEAETVQENKEIEKKSISEDVNLTSIEKEAETEISQDTMIALVIPSKQIGKYSQEAVNSINSYFLYNNKKYKLAVYDIGIQNELNIKNGIEKIKKDEIKNVIALLTPEFLQDCKAPEMFEGLNIYFPIINKFDLNLDDRYNNDNLVFGGISYKNQIDSLLKDKNYENLVEFYDDSIVGEKLHLFTSNYKTKYSKKVDDNNRAYKSFLSDKKLEGSILVLNTPIIKSSILLSQIRSLNINLKYVLSTQLNYTPLILSLTQKEDRRNVIVTSSIGEIPFKLKEINGLLDNALEYSWVNYTIIVGVDYLVNDLNSFKDLESLDNQIIYPIKKFKARDHSFHRLK